GTKTLTITGTLAQNGFAFSQASTQDAGGALHTRYTFNLNGNGATYPDTSVAKVVVSAAGGPNSASLTTSDTYTGNDGQNHETAEAVTIGNRGGKVQKLDANGNAADFMTLTGFQVAFAVAGAGDEGFIVCTPSVKNVFVGAGGY